MKVSTNKDKIYVYDGYFSYKSAMWVVKLLKQDCYSKNFGLKLLLEVLYTKIPEIYSQFMASQISRQTPYKEITTRTCGACILIKSLS